MEPLTLKKVIFAPLFVLAVACGSDRDDDVRRDTDGTDPAEECTLRCSKERDECAKACTDDGDCIVACTDKARDCDLSCK
jgi:hypothetical protein